MRLYFSIDYERPPDIAKRRWPGISRDAMGEVGALWDSKFKARHFEPGAADRYGYQPRSPAYLAKKRRLAGLSGQARGKFRISPNVDRALVFSGDLRRAVLMRHLPRAFPTRVTVNMPTPRYAQMKPYKTGRPNLGEELTKVTPDEFVDLENRYRDELEVGIEAARASKTVRIN